MVLAGLDIATTTGRALAIGETIVASSFRPRARRPQGIKPSQVDFLYEGEVAREFGDELRAWLVANEVEAVAIEKPIPPDLKFKKQIINPQAEFAGEAVQFEERGGTTFGTIFRIYSLVSKAAEICARLNLDVYPVSQDLWRKAFIGQAKAPKGTTDRKAWLKRAARQRCEQLGIKISNNDQSDACGIVFWLREQMTQPKDLLEGAGDAPE